MDYQEFLESKKLVAPSVGKPVEASRLPANLFEHQKAGVKWATKKGRGAAFWDTGLGKTPLQTTWAREIADRSLILAPLAVAQQTIREAAKFDTEVTYARSQDQSPKRGITITNYEMLQHFDLDQFEAVVLDESSILSNADGKFRNALIQGARNVPYKLTCTATPIPNDIVELGSHAEFLGVMTRAEMLAAFFIHDETDWRLSGHAAAGPFWEWLASWAQAMRKPSDLGFDNAGYDLPQLHILPQFVAVDYVPPGKLFFDRMSGVTDRADIRRTTLTQRVAKAAELALSDRSNQWLMWHGLNDEGDALLRLFEPGEAVLVEGSQSPEHKAEALERFARGDYRVLITKPKIAGQGLNFQSCSRMAFVGLSDSYREYYQAIRRCYRFGQTEEVQAHIVLADIEDQIYQNVLKKEREADQLLSQLIEHVQQYEIRELAGAVENVMPYEVKTASGKDWRLMLGDSTERLAELPDNSIDFSVFSQPFAKLFVYSNSPRDLGNCKNYDEFWQHFEFIYRQLYRVMKPGRVVAAHVQQIALTKAEDDDAGFVDFRGDTIRHFKEVGFVYDNEITIFKDPQVQAIRLRGRAKGLRFAQKDKDRSWLRPALADYIIKFRKPGRNETPIVGDVSNQDWIEWASPVWFDCGDGKTLNAAEARSDDDAKHMCPLQLPTIERCIRLWSNPGETILDPFNGIGSSGYVALQNNRKYLGVELNPKYYSVSLKNLNEAERLAGQTDLFTFAGVEVEGVA